MGLFLELKGVVIMQKKLDMNQILSQKTKKKYLSNQRVQFIHEIKMAAEAHGCQVIFEEETGKIIEIGGPENKQHECTVAVVKVLVKYSKDEVTFFVCASCMAPFTAFSDTKKCPYCDSVEIHSQ